MSNFNPQPAAPSHHSLSLAGAALFALVLLFAAATGAVPLDERSGEQLFLEACANCHGGDGRGAPQTQLGFDLQVPDFTDCSFASREPVADWVAVAHEGGPVRGFSELMPAFGGVLDPVQLERIVLYIRSLCTDKEWPLGEFNLPRSLVTGKAYPEDEVVFTTTVDTEELDSVESKIVYEKRFGARNMWELVLPIAWWEAEDPTAADGSHWTNGIGDVAVAVKRVMYHDLDRGAILSLAGELILPTGDEESGNGSGTTVFEPFLTWGQLLPADFFMQSQVGVKVPVDRDHDDEAFLRLNFGRSFTSGGPYGRTWSPMVDVAASRKLDSGETTHWDLAPQFQVTLNTRQHIMLGLGVRLPLNDTDSRHTTYMAYLLWDWFDGGFLEGW